MWIVQNSLEQLVVSILQQLVEIWQVGRTEPTALAAAQISDGTQRTKQFNNWYLPELYESRHTTFFCSCVCFHA